MTVSEDPTPQTRQTARARRHLRPTLARLGAVLFVSALATTGITLAASDDTPTSPESVRPLLIGATAPEATVQTLAGESKNLQELIHGKKSILIFYRGGW